MWRWSLDFYNNPRYDKLIQRTPAGKKKFFLPSPLVPAYANQSLVDRIESNGELNDVEVTSMWAMSK